MADATEIQYPWRVGRTVGRTIYACPAGTESVEGSFLIGVMDSPEIAEHVVALHIEAWKQEYDRRMSEWRSQR